MSEDNINNCSRKIDYIAWVEGEAEQVWTTRAGKFKNCDEIQPYYEEGQMAGVPWLRVIEKGIVIARCNCALIREIGYDRSAT